MKILGFKLLLFFLIFAVIAPMLMRGPDGEPIMTLDDWIPHDLIALVVGASSSVSDTVVSTGAELGVEGLVGTVGAGVEIYTWTDESGVLHYSDTPIQGAAPMLVPQDGLEIPAERFVRSGLAPVKPASRSGNKGRSILLDEAPFPEASNGSSSASLGDVEAMARGDFSNAAEVMQNLPELLEQLKVARGQVRAE